MFNGCMIHGVKDTDYNAFGQETENKLKELAKGHEIIDVQLQFVSLGDGEVEYNAFIFYK